MIRIERCREVREDWLDLCLALWPGSTREEHAQHARGICAEPARFLVLLAHADDGGSARGFAEAALRRDYVNGTDSSPVLFLEAIYVAPGARRRGVARALADAVAVWGREQGCREFASDALLDNHDSHRFHRAIGFAETERVVYFRRELA